MRLALLLLLSHAFVVFPDLVAFMTNARAHFIGTKPVFLSSDNFSHVFSVVDDHAVVAKLL